MAVKLFTRLKGVAFSGLQKPENYPILLQNLFRVSVWGTLGSGSTALASFIFNRSIVQESPWKGFASYVFKASLGSCGTFTLFTAFLIYKIWQMTSTSKEWTTLAKPLNDQVVSLEYGLMFPPLTGAVAIVGYRYLNPTQMIESLAHRFITPLTWIALTTSAIGHFHIYQEKQIGDTHD